ncbi:FecR family protein [Winogradskyella marincola]|uniref:FecR domain-containing protein n=1 Tax=Winogradskyella marincola TaxID=3037795 RepID=A0ABT6G4N8_9FLAO|nr:FecR domain-containing protein [Winogradskyella sp. YYF002]MDG4717011.1 FecR domain-containing protein [Winogradskyella sp. YYF002]
MNKDNDILKWFNGEISTEEIKAMYPNEDFSALEKAGFYSKQIETPYIDANKALADFKTRSLNKTKKETSKVVPLNYKMLLRVAAIVVLMLTCSYFIFFNTEASYKTGVAETTTLNLPDDSEVVLNAKSQLTYNKKEWDNQRLLTLDGEAYFKVTKGKKFTVNTDAGSVEVLGTQFNVKERSNFFEVKCYEGSVAVTYDNETTVLAPGKSVRVVSGKMIKIDDFTSQNPSWINEESSFNNVPLWQVIEDLQLQYNIKIKIVDGVDTSQLFSGSFTHKDKNIALKAVTIPLKLSYKINGNDVEFYNYGAN